VLKNIAVSVTKRERKKGRERERDEKNCCKNKWSVDSFVGIHGCDPNFTISLLFSSLLSLFHFRPEDYKTFFKRKECFYALG
jgi:hypothetical protein